MKQDIKEMVYCLLFTLMWTGILIIGYWYAYIR